MQEREREKNHLGCYWYLQKMDWNRVKVELVSSDSDNRMKIEFVESLDIYVKVKLQE